MRVRFEKRVRARITDKRDREIAVRLPAATFRWSKIRSKLSELTEAYLMDNNDATVPF